MQIEWIITLVDVIMDLNKSILINDVVCLLRFFVVNIRKKFIELILQPKKDLDGCDKAQSIEDNQPCVNLYGTAAVLCQLGQCRCNATLSFAYENKSCCKYPIN
jgi:hypothetical protein